jgi:hypothetical protein
MTQEQKIIRAKLGLLELARQLGNVIEWPRPPASLPPDAGCWCSRNKRRPYVSSICCSTPSGHGNGLRPWIRTNPGQLPVNLTLTSNRPM